MTEAFDIIDSNATVKYAFHFTSFDQPVQLTQQQLDLIPYLSVFIAHKDDFLSVQNENGKYLLNEPIQYASFNCFTKSI